MPYGPYGGLIDASNAQNQSAAYVTGPTASYMGATGQGQPGQMFNTTSKQWENPPLSYYGGNAAARPAGPTDLVTGRPQYPGLDQPTPVETMEYRIPHGADPYTYRGPDSRHIQNYDPTKTYDQNGNLVDTSQGSSYTTGGGYTGNAPSGSQFNPMTGQPTNSGPSDFFSLLNRLYQLRGMGTTGAPMGSTQPTSMGNMAYGSLQNMAYQYPYATNQAIPDSNAGQSNDQTGSGPYGLQSIAMGNRSGLRSVFGRTGGSTVPGGNIPNQYQPPLT